MRRLAWPPSSPSASRPSWSRSKTTPRASRSLTAPGASSTSTRTADGRQSPRPAASVSSAWRSGESPGSSAAASPPWAQKLALWESGVRETRQTSAPCSAARSAVQRPAAPPPTTATPNSGPAAIAAQPLGGSSPAARAASQPRLRGPAPSRRRPSARPSAARRSASSTRFSAASAWASISVRRSPAAAIACSLASRSRCRSSSWASRCCWRTSSRFGLLALEVGLQRPDLGRRAPLGLAGHRGRRLQPAFGLLDLPADALAAGTTRFSAHAGSI